MNPNNHASGPLISLRGLSVSFNGRMAASDISFDLAKGECLGIVGESGSGKSVSALSIIGLLPANASIDAGSILISDAGSGKVHDLLRLPEKKMRSFRGRDISMIFQEPMTSLNPVKRCGQQVAEVMVHHLGMSRREAKAEVISLFKEVLLPEPAKVFSSFPHQLSGGQRQRVMIAQAIACKPRLLIADEPTTALDVTVQKTIVELLKDLQRKYGMTMIFITHDLGLVSKVADRIAVMHKGRMVEMNETAGILTNPVHPYTQGLLACRPTLETHTRRLPTLADFMNDSPANAMTSKEQGPDYAIDYAGEPLLDVRSLQVSFALERNFLGKASAWLNAVDKVSLQVWKGETLGLVGESGCGKTTLGRALLRLQDSVAGEVYFDGRELRSMKASEMKMMRKRMQIIFQDPYSSLNPKQSIGSAITEAMRVHHLNGNSAKRRKAAQALMEQVGLDPDTFHRYPHEFSGGQRQRICIARALAVEPEFIICDESVSALDVSVQAQVLNLLKDLKDQYGLTYIFISHDLAVVKYMSDRIAVMQKGRILELQESESLYSSAKEQYTQSLIDAIPVINIAVSSP